PSTRPPPRRPSPPGRSAPGASAGLSRRAPSGGPPLPRSVASTCPDHGRLPRRAPTGPPLKEIHVTRLSRPFVAGAGALATLSLAAPWASAAPGDRYAYDQHGDKSFMTNTNVLERFSPT